MVVVEMVENRVREGIIALVPQPVLEGKEKQMFGLEIVNVDKDQGLQVVHRQVVQRV